jgi:DNA-directed RNA polymerase specialized sigma24 family protein
VSAPRDPSAPPLDWQDLRASIRRRVGYLLRGWTAEEIEDVTQDVVFKVLRFLERSGHPDNLEGLLTVIARRTAVERIRVRARRPAHEPMSEEFAVTLDEAARHELAELEELVAWRAFQVTEFFRAHHAPCLELAEARARGVDFKRLAEQTQQSHRALLQRWSRCMRRLRVAIAEGRIPWDRPRRGA